MTSALLLCACFAVAEEPSSYPRAKLLIEVDALADSAIAKRYRILDARTKARYEQGHVPGAVWVDLEVWSKTFAAQQDPKQWADKIGKLGIDAGAQVVVYDDVLSKDAARVWWLLRYWGVKDVRLLNGGWPAWTKAGFPVSKEAAAIEPVRFVIEAPQATRLATKSQVLDLLKDKRTQIIDTRSEKEFCGDDKLKNKRGGAIPGAIHLEWSDALDPKTQKFKSAGDLTKIFKDAGIDVAKPSVTYCQSGGRAAVMAFTLELMGAKDVANYYRSWSEWGNDESTPIVQPRKKPK